MSCGTSRQAGVGRPGQLREGDGDSAARPDRGNGTAGSGWVRHGPRGYRSHPSGTYPAARCLGPRCLATRAGADRLAAHQVSGTVGGLEPVGGTAYFCKA